TCTSTCRGSVTYRSRNTVSSANAPRASRLAVASAAGRSATTSTRCMPLPPPPAAGLTRTGNPIACAASTRSSSVRPGRCTPGTTISPRLATSTVVNISPSDPALHPEDAVAERGELGPGARRERESQHVAGPHRVDDAVVPQPGGGVVRVALLLVLRPHRRL